MRPDALTEFSSSRPRKQSITNGRRQPPSGPTTFFLTSESALDSPVPSALPRPPLQEVVDSASLKRALPRSPVISASRREGSRRRSTVIRPRSIEELRLEAARQQSPVQIGSETPILTSSSQEPSLPSSPKSISSRSLPKSDASHDGGSSQAVESDEEEDHANTMSVEDSAPQLIMPSIRMPSRRPFTERGKQLGRIKIMVLGEKGTGKTSLIKSIVQLCEDIVHVDPISNSTILRSKGSSRTANAFQETYASTKPYPAWWSDVDESRVLKRRKSMGDLVLERNICFVDTSHDRDATLATAYIKQQLQKSLLTTGNGSTEMTSLLSGFGGSQVDLVLYLVSHDTFDHDKDQINQLSQIANVVPLIAKSELLNTTQLDEMKAALSSSNCAIPRLPLVFGSQHSEITASSPYSISCVNGPDYDNMDASLLMSTEYVQPLLPSELSLLIDQIFQPDNVSYLRHMSAKKLTTWYQSGALLPESIRTPSPTSTRMRSPVPSTLNSPIQASLSASGVLVPIASHSDFSLNTSNSFALARVADHAAKEDRLAHIRLSKWASDLQLSLQREREKYESIARSKRALWLVERMGEEIRDGQLVSVTSDVEEGEADIRGSKSKRRIYKDASMTYQVHDPLGLMKWQHAVWAQGWLTLQVVGSFGVIGGLALFVTKAFGYETSFH